MNMRMASVAAAVKSKQRQIISENSSPLPDQAFSGYLSAKNTLVKADKRPPSRQVRYLRQPPEETAIRILQAPKVSRLLLCNSESRTSPSQLVGLPKGLIGLLRTLWLPRRAELMDSSQSLTELGARSTQMEESKEPRAA